MGSARVREKGAEAMGGVDLAGKAEGLEEMRAVEAAEQAIGEEEAGIWILQQKSEAQKWRREDK